MAWEPVIVVTSAALAVLLVALRWSRWPASSPRPPLDQPVGPVRFRPGESWASSVTAVGAFLTAVVSSNVLPPQGRYLPVLGYALLTLFFAFLVVVAPFVYNATGSPAPGPPAGPALTEGRVWTFLLTTALTLWAVFGQLATLGLSAAELGRLSATFSVFLVVLVAVAALMLVYSWRTMGWVLEAQADHEVARLSALADAAAPDPGPRPRWTLL